MPAILHHRSPESSINFTINFTYLYTLVLKGFLTRKIYYRQRTLIMNILDIIKARIIRDFPNITPEELSIRIEYAQKLLERIE